MAERLQEIIFEVVTENRWKIIAWEIMPDHVHLLVNVKPTDSASFVMQRVKGRASSYLRKKVRIQVKNSSAESPKIW
ncbi:MULTISPECIES: IS200/IS605 family transposase [unclassified Microcoleus]|uniref:IS200/IS605 family transposase n=1 Tax=unclassified Microcoleus TaxID=2642155 RepID=UPI00404072B6